MEEKKFRLRLNLFDCIVVLAALAVGAFLRSEERRVGKEC